MAKEFVKFLNKTPSPWHAVHELSQILKAGGYTELKEATSAPWALKKGGKYYMLRNQSALFAFSVGGNFDPTKDARFAIIGAHTDSPCIKIKPSSKIERHGMVQVGVECYGGGQWPTWLDRDLRIAGRIIYRNGKQLAHKLVHIDKAFCRIPTIAIHLSRDAGTKLEINKEDHTTPVLAIAKKIEDEVAKEFNNGSIRKRHHSVLLDAISTAAGLDIDDIVDFELCLADHQPAAIGGVFDEFVYGPRLDNLQSCYAAVKGLLNADATLETDSVCRLVTCFDHEEVGSNSAPGAGSALPSMVLKRIIHGVEGNINTDACAYDRSIPRSLCLSADMAHALHPNYASKHEPRMGITLEGGPAIKYNANQRYATSAETAAVIREMARRADVPVQEICNRNDVPCGSTIGPITATGLGIPTVDIGAPQLSMHSIREMCHVSCINQCETLFTQFFNTFGEYYLSSDDRFLVV